MDEWISREAATDLLIREHGLSVGAAKNASRAALRSGNVEIRARLGNLPDLVTVFPEDVLEFPGALAYRDVRVNLSDWRPADRPAPR